MGTGLSDGGLHDPARSTRHCSDDAGEAAARTPCQTGVRPRLTWMRRNSLRLRFCPAECGAHRPVVFSCDLFRGEQP